MEPMNRKQYKHNRTNLKSTSNLDKSTSGLKDIEFIFNSRRSPCHNVSKLFHKFNNFIRHDPMGNQRIGITCPVTQS